MGSLLSPVGIGNVVHVIRTPTVRIRTVVPPLKLLQSRSGDILDHPLLLQATLRPTVPDVESFSTSRSAALRVYTICNIARNNFNVFSLSVTLRETISTCFHYPQHCAQQFQRLSTICNIARSNFNVFPLSATLRAAILTSFHYLQHCAQQFQRLSTICNITRSNFNVFPLSATLRTAISTSFHSVQHCAQQFQGVSIYYL